MCELFHCRPSELDEEDGWQCLRLLQLQHWRDAAWQYKHDQKNMDVEARIRIHRLLQGDSDALTREMDTGKGKSDADRMREFLKEVNG